MGLYFHVYFKGEVNEWPTACLCCSQVLVVAHSNIMFDGSSLPDGEDWICCLVKDSLYKAFFIRIIDPKVHYPDILHLSSTIAP